MKRNSIVITYENEGKTLATHNVLFYNWTHTRIFFPFFFLSHLSLFYVVFYLWEWLLPLTIVRPWIRKEKKVLFFCLNFMRLLEHSHFIIAHRNLILPLCYYRYSSLEYTEERSFYDVEENSFLFFVLLGPLQKKRVKFISFFFFFFVFYSLWNSNIIIMNNDGYHHYYRHYSVLCTPTFHVDCTYLTIEELDFLIVLSFLEEWKQTREIFDLDEKNVVFFNSSL